MQEQKFSSAELTSVNEQTYGQKAVGINFNPSNDDAIYICKKRYADLIDEMNDLRINSNSQEQKRLCSIAITEIQSAQMWSVKALTWKDDSVVKSEELKFKKFIGKDTEDLIKESSKIKVLKDAGLLTGMQFGGFKEQETKKEEIDNITYFFKSIFSIISIRKVITKGLYAIENDSFKISINVVLEENVFRVSNGENRKENEIHIEISNSILFNSSDDFLLFFFMWCWFQRFENTDKNYMERFELSDALSLQHISERVTSLNYENLLFSVIDFFGKSVKDITPEQESRIHNFGKLIDKYKG